MAATLAFAEACLDVIEKYVPSKRICKSIVHEICTIPSQNLSVIKTQERLWNAAQARWK